MDADQTLYSAMRDKVAELQIKNAFLLHELKVCKKCFEHHGLEGHAWVCEQAILMGDNDGKS